MIASDHAERVMRIPENLAERGSANSNEVTISGCTTNTEPNDSATACMTYPPPSPISPAHHRGLRINDATNASPSGPADAARC